MHGRTQAGTLSRLSAVASELGRTRTVELGRDVDRGLIAIGNYNIQGR